ncbi:[protein-PII] uridylyltransferase [Paraburkholderia hospita]|jgi:[protein-PII] uridylyltransferase|uniref:[protein-PII] uridylyltransferase n=1 Tax=Paraburkholderia hospita TaxID=169430 RepID=UPI000271C7F9|nr:[protein-PII] uridylyltransferase [Paraburkholderia hospita]EUC18159.1 UTP-GlnB uridylyltransferase, GlnD / adenyl transferase, GlnE [Burkholderia sp. BT03]SKC74524.1 UTP--GlnB (protein PII) uridylyltransferase, GlnD [Burkholderia sp. CF099]AXE98166.1 [protein-PII] uridylyltransferase [Paraburkholderia hospita]OUL77908.1 bifunctional uridylyltransferase/uridylyl-removing protein [Paraburkholderia hospita]OUL94196.1 bifunctional uridylyltransferase/uridylyl-removing protein [Paraburkholderia
MSSVHAVALSDATSLKADYKVAKTPLLDRFKTATNVDTLMHALARITDDALRGAWAACELPASLALLAVGGYGRGELAPHSDIDILVLLPDEPVAHLEARIERFIGLAWDLGLELGSSVRTVSQCIEESANDVTVQTSLLEARRIVGSTALFETFSLRYRDALDPRAFFQAKVLEMRQRHAKFQDSPYSLEPNVKESPGGLRDLQLILWITQAAGFGCSWRELDARGLITDREARELRRNEGFLKTLRARLHVLAGRRQDILVFDLQNPLAESFGFKATSTRRASEQLMRRYYWAAKAVTQLSTILIQNIEAQLFPSTSGITRVLSDRFVEKQGMLEIASDDVFEREPNAILEAFLLYEETPGVKGLSARTLRALYNARDKMDHRWRRDPENRRLFMEILKQPQGITHAMRLMNQTSVLGRYLLNFRRIVGQMQHDLYHVYTVDQHILMVLRNMRRFAVAEHAHEYPFCSQLIVNFERPYVLYVAALFHDIAKGRGGDHSTLGMADARRFCREHDISTDDTALIVWLVQHHLTMSQVAQKQDTSDPEVIKRFADLVGTERRLTALYLLTVADIRGTSPKVWNTWKGKLLEDLYRATLAVLGGARPDAHSELKQRQEEALALLRLETVPENAHRALWDKLDVGYFLRHDAADIAWQTRVLHRHVETETPIVRARPSPIGEALQVLVYVKDRPDLFAGICAYFDRNSLSVLDARVSTTRHGYALDNFLVAHTERDVHYRDIANLVEQELAGRLRAEGTLLPEPSKGRLSRLSRTFPVTPRVDLRADERGQYYILSVSANDRPGLLYSIARVLAEHRVGVHAARINTLGERVEDVFLLDGHGLSDNRRQIQVETELLRAIAV